MLCWLFLCIYPLYVYFSRYYNSSSSFIKISAFALIMLLIHSQLDLLLFEWPGSLMAPLLCGIMWGFCLHRKTDFKPSRTGRLFAGTAVIGIVVITFFQISASLKSSYFERSAQLSSIANRTPETAASYTNAIEFAPENPSILYAAGKNAFINLKDKQLAALYFSMLRETPSQNFMHNNAFEGYIASQNSKIQEAKAFFQKECRNYPLMTTAWFNLYQANRSLNLQQEAQMAWQGLQISMLAKNLRPDALDYLLKHPDQDISPGRLPADIKERFAIQK